MDTSATELASNDSVFSPIQMTLPAKKKTALSKRRTKMRRTVAPAYRRLNLNHFLDAFSNKLGPVLCEFIRLKMRSKNSYSKRQLWISMHAMLTCGARGYQFLRTSLHLPSRVTLMNYMRKVKSRPGLSIQSTKLLKVKLNNKSSMEKLGFILIDEVSIRRGLTYDQASDTIIGFEDCGRTRTSNLAVNALVVMVVGVLSKWKQPIGYVLTSGAMKSPQVKVLLEDTLDLLKDEGFVILGITSDQGSNFESAFRLLGSTPEDPRIWVKGDSYIVHRDPPHLIKNARNFLHSKPVNVPFYTYPAKWEHLVDLFILDQRSSLQLAPRLSSKHLFEIRFQSKMKVKLAAQILSNSSSAALDCCVADGSLDASSSATSSYCKVFNDLFDALNSSTSKCAVSLRRPLTSTSKIMIFLEEKLIWLQELRDLNKSRRNVFIQGKPIMNYNLNSVN